MRGIAHIGIAVGLVATHCAFASVWYVNKASTSTTENGRSWGTAFKTIQPAIDAASTAGGGEVWVAKGVYDEARFRPDREGNTGALLIRSATSIYGGFSGRETSLTQRDWTANLTTIDGSLSRDGTNAFHVVETSSNTVLNGFTVRGGNASDIYEARRCGAGLLVSGTTVTVENCTFDHNNAQEGGSGMSTSGMVEAEFRNCHFRGNGGGDGSAAYPQGGSLTFTRCTFKGNRHGALFLFAGSVNVSGCLFQDNIAAITLGSASTLRVYNSVFTGNRRTIYASGNYICDEGCWYTNSVMIFGCTFYNNTATHGGAIWSETTPMWVENSIFWSNSPESIYFGPNHYTGTSVDFKNCIVQGGFAVGVNILDQDPLFVNPTKGDFRLMPSSPAIDSGENLDYLAPLFPHQVPPNGRRYRRRAASATSRLRHGRLRVSAPAPRPMWMAMGRRTRWIIQVAINSALGLATDYLGDINHDGASDAVDIQLVINAALNL